MKFFTDIDHEEMVPINSEQPHSRSMRAMAARLRAGESVAVALRLIEKLVPVADLPPWASDRFLDPRTRVIIGPDDSIRRARPDDAVYCRLPAAPKLAGTLLTRSGSGSVLLPVGGPPVPRKRLSGRSHQGPRPGRPTRDAR